MNNVVVLGAGKIGRTVSHLLGSCGDYALRVADADERAVEQAARLAPGATASTLDFGDEEALGAFLEGARAVVSCAPFHKNPSIARVARKLGVHYLDITEDVEVTRQVRELAEDAPCAFIPQCGLAPGFITIVTHHLLGEFEEVEDVRMRVGALPRFPSNRLRYNLTWSTEGLINEYLNPCEAVSDGRLVEVPPLEGLEHVRIDGVDYEAFHTSGGAGSLARTLAGRVRSLTYKTLRHPGHVERVRLLLDDLGLRRRPDLLREIFEAALPATDQDQVVIHVSVTGRSGGRLLERTYAKTIRHGTLGGRSWTAIQITTASGVCAVLDLLLSGRLPDRGFVRQEDVPYEAFVENRFGRVYAD